MDLQEQIVNITKAHAFDIVSVQVSELKEQNENFRNAIMEIWNSIAKADATTVITNPTELLMKICATCQEAVTKNKPL